MNSTSGTDSASRGITYREAGVDIDAATDALAQIKRFAHSTFETGASGAPVGHFGGVYRLDAGPDRFLVASADGIGTKIKLAFILGGDAHRRVGADLVNHCVNDILACGARPLFFLDYVAMGSLDPGTLTLLIEGMATACRDNGLALIGGETAEMPGLYREGEYDAAGFIVGEVAPDRYLDGTRVAAGDRLIGLPALGLHTNGFSLARRILGLTDDRQRDAQLLAEPLPGGDGQTIGDALLMPHPSYLPAVQPLIAAGLVHGIAHITGGGLVDNLPRILPPDLAARLDPAGWSVNPIFQYLVERGPVAPDERYRAFNMGIGMVLAVGQQDVDEALTLIPGARLIGEVVPLPAGNSKRVLGLA